MFISNPALNSYFINKKKQEIGWRNGMVLSAFNIGLDPIKGKHQNVL